MANNKEIVKLAVDLYHGSVEKYSKSQAEEALRQALIEANGGKDYIDIHDLQSGKCAECFRLIEEILDITVPEGLTGNEFFMRFCEYRNVALGDRPVFEIEDSDVFYLAEIADGTQALRRQRIGGVKEFTVPTKTYGIRIYEEMNRVLAKRADFNSLITKVTEATVRHLNEQIFKMWTELSATDMGGTTYFPVAGAYNEEALLDLVAHTEAVAGGKQAIIVGTKKALRKLQYDKDIIGNSVKDDYYNMGYVGSFMGTPVMAIPQQHKVGSTDWIMPDDVLTIIAGDQKMIKVVNEGSPLILYTMPTQNQDLTYEYTVIQKWGVSIVTGGKNAGIGRYQITA